MIIHLYKKIVRERLMIAEDTKVDEDEDTTIYDQTMTMITDDD